MSFLLGHRRRRLLGVAAALAVAAAVALVLARTVAKRPQVVAAPDTVAALDPSNDRLVETFGVGRVPAQLAIGEGALWVFNSADGTVSRIEPRTQTIRTFPIGRGSRPRIGLALGPDSGWVAVGTVYRLDLRSAAARKFRLPKRAWAGIVAAGPADVWLIGGKRPLKLARPGPPLQALAWHVDPQTNEITRAIRLSMTRFSVSITYDCGRRGRFPLGSRPARCRPPRSPNGPVP